MTSAKPLSPHKAWLAALLLLSLPAHAALAPIHGRIEVQDVRAFSRGDSLAAALGAKNRNDVFANLRLAWEPSWNDWSFSFHYVLAGDYGDGARLTRTELGLLPSPPATWFNLTETFENHGEVIASQSIDRLSIGYATPHFVIRVGRQALTWGSGIVFRPMDLFDPFGPGATDTEYKPGTDMLYAQWLFDDGSDLQLVVVPRPAKKGAAPSSDSSSAALHFQTTVLGHPVTALVSRDHGDWATGVGVNGALGGATWNLEFEPTFLDRGGTRVSALANISDAVTLFGHNATLFAEYFHNGFGTSDRISFARLPPELGGRLARGQLSNVRRDYLASGMTFEAGPLLTLSPLLIGNLDDRSLYAIFAATYSIEDDLTLVAGAQAPLGPAGSEYGGIALTPGGSVFLGPPSQLYLQLRRYF